MTSSTVAGGAIGGERSRSTPAAGLVTSALTLVIVMFGLGAPAMKLISVPPVAATAARFWISVPVVWAITYAAGRRVPRSVLRRTALPGTLFGANMIFVFAALQHSSVAVAAVIQALGPAVVLVLAAPLLGERATLVHVLWTGLGILGVVVVVIGGDPEVSGDAFGVLAALASMLAFVGYYVLNRHVRTSAVSIDPLQWMAGVTLFAALAVTPLAIFTASVDDFGRIGAADWMYLAFIVAILGVVSHVTMSWVHGFVPASRSSPALLGSNVVSIAIAWPLHDEPITLLQAIGSIVVLASVLAILRKPSVSVAGGALRQE